MEERELLFSRPSKMLESKEYSYMKDMADYIGCNLNEIAYSFYDGRLVYGSDDFIVENRFNKLHKYNDKGYIFYYHPSYDVAQPIAHFYFKDNKWGDLTYYSASIQHIKDDIEDEKQRALEEMKLLEKRREARRREQLQEQRRKEKRNFVLKKLVVPGVAITSAGILALIGFGAIKPLFDKQPSEIVQQVQNLNTVANANDLLLVSWANHAMTELDNISIESDYEQIKYMADYLKEEFFTPIMSSYYNYVEDEMLELPIEIIGNSIKTNHNSFRNNAYLFDEELKSKGFNSCSFANSPYANAIVVDAYGKVISNSDGELFGEVYDSNGELITTESEMGYIVYVRAEDVLGNDYGTSNYPNDAIMYNGVAYVNSSHLYDFEAPSFGNK